MKKVIFVLGIFAVIICVSAIAFSVLNTPQSYAMTVSDMQAVFGGDDVHQQQYCASRVGGCDPLHCNPQTYYICMSDPDPIRVCVDAPANPGQKICDGEGACLAYYGKTVCTSYPY